MARWKAWVSVGLGGLVVAVLGLLEYYRRLASPGFAEWNWQTGRFAWGSGEVRLPHGFFYTADMGMDSDVGHFTGPGGRVVIRHDIGAYAGAWATPCRSLMVEAWEANGARVWLGASAYSVAVTFPDSGMANFWVERVDREAIQVLEALARSFRPVGLVERSLQRHCR